MTHESGMIRYDRGNWDGGTGRRQVEYGWVVVHFGGRGDPTVTEGGRPRSHPPRGRGVVPVPETRTECEDSDLVTPTLKLIPSLY